MGYLDMFPKMSTTLKTIVYISTPSATGIELKGNSGQVKAVNMSSANMDTLTYSFPICIILIPFCFLVASPTV